VFAYELLTGTHPFDAGAGAQSLKFPPPRRAELSAPQYSALVHGLQPDRSNRTPTVGHSWQSSRHPSACRSETRCGRPRHKTGVVGRAIKPGVIARATGAGAAVLLCAVVAWFSVHRAPVPAPVAASPGSSKSRHGNPRLPDVSAMTVLPAGRFKQGSAPAESGAVSFAGRSTG